VIPYLWNTVKILRKITGLYLCNSSTCAVAFSLSLYLQCIQGFLQPSGSRDPSSPPACHAGDFLAPFAGRLSDKVEPRIVASAGMLMTAAGLAMQASTVYIGNTQIVPSNYSQFVTALNTAFAVLTVLCTLGILAYLARGRILAKSV
jgi:hypothetical protein